MEAYFLTDIGKVRSHNEDSGGIFFNKEGQVLALIADGMGGHLGGDVASQMATEFIKKQWEIAEKKIRPNEVETWIKETIDGANKVIFEGSLESEDLKGMGTTVVLVVCLDEFISIAHVGDSRCYLYENENLKQITEDHTFIHELVKTGQISADDAELHPRKNVLLRALGTEENIKADIHTMEWDKGNKVLLCSDGLSNKVTDEELQNHLGNSEDTEAISESLVSLANERGGEDNITLAIVHHTSLEEVGEEL
ncbi:Stp1/IreP family PP2C-type Ser/Thr phosphatase [Oceanobacillus sp. CAU 1775]